MTIILGVNDRFLFKLAKKCINTNNNKIKMRDKISVFFFCERYIGDNFN